MSNVSRNRPTVMATEGEDPSMPAQVPSVTPKASGNNNAHMAAIEFEAERQRLARLNIMNSIPRSDAFPMPQPGAFSPAYSQELPRASISSQDITRSTQGMDTPSSANGYTPRQEIRATIPSQDVTRSPARVFGQPAVDFRAKQPTAILSRDRPSAPMLAQPNHRPLQRPFLKVASVLTVNFRTDQRQIAQMMALIDLLADVTPRNDSDLSDACSFIYRQNDVLLHHSAIRLIADDQGVCTIVVIHALTHFEEVTVTDLFNGQLLRNRGTIVVGIYTDSEQVLNVERQLLDLLYYGFNVNALVLVPLGYKNGDEQFDSVTQIIGDIRMRNSQSSTELSLTNLEDITSQVALMRPTGEGLHVRPFTGA